MKHETFYTVKTARPVLAGTPEPKRKLNPKGLTWAQMVAEERTRHAKWLGNSMPDDMVQENRRPGRPTVDKSELTRVQKKVLGMIDPKNGTVASDVAEELGMSGGHMKRAFARLYQEGFLDRVSENNCMGTGWRYRYYPRAAQ